jgi:hypothetical protein
MVCRPVATARGGLLSAVHTVDAHTLILCSFSQREKEGSRRKWAVIHLRVTRQEGGTPVLPSFEH